MGKEISMQSIKKGQIVYFVNVLSERRQFETITYNPDISGGKEFDNHESLVAYAVELNAYRVTSIESIDNMYGDDEPTHSLWIDLKQFDYKTNKLKKAENGKGFVSPQMFQPSQNKDIVTDISSLPNRLMEEINSTKSNPSMSIAPEGLIKINIPNDALIEAVRDLFPEYII